jgi:hypothetical protein
MADLQNLEKRQLLPSARLLHSRHRAPILAGGAVALVVGGLFLVPVVLGASIGLFEWVIGGLVLLLGLAALLISEELQARATVKRWLNTGDPRRAAYLALCYRVEDLHVAIEHLEHQLDPDEDTLR